MGKKPKSKKLARLEAELDKLEKRRAPMVAVTLLSGGVTLVSLAAGSALGLPDGTRWVGMLVLAVSFWIAYDTNKRGLVLAQQIAKLRGDKPSQKPKEPEPSAEED